MEKADVPATVLRRGTRSRLPQRAGPWRKSKELCRCSELSGAGLLFSQSKFGKERRARAYGRDTGGGAGGGEPARKVGDGPGGGSWVEHKASAHITLPHRGRAGRGPLPCLRRADPAPLPLGLRPVSLPFHHSPDVGLTAQAQHSLIPTRILPAAL